MQRNRVWVRKAIKIQFFELLRLPQVYQIFQNFESLYNILHILTQVIQTSCLVTHFCAQAIFKVPVLVTHFLLTKRYNSK